MAVFLINLVNTFVNVITIVVIAEVVLSYFLPPYHQVRRILDSLVSPLLNPIRRVVPPISGLDFSPMILLIAVQVIGMLLIRIIISL